MRVGGWEERRVELRRIEGRLWREGGRVELGFRRLCRRKVGARGGGRVYQPSERARKRARETTNCFENEGRREKAWEDR